MGIESSTGLMAFSVAAKPFESLLIKMDNLRGIFEITSNSRSGLFLYLSKTVEKLYFLNEEEKL